MAKPPEKTYGRIRLDSDARQWVIAGVAPNISLRIKDMFRRIDKVSTTEFRFPDDNLHCFELLWFMDRWPLEISPLDGARLKAGKKRYFAAAKEVETIFTPDFKAPEYVGLAEDCALWAYQAQAVEMFRRVKRLLLGDDLGLGKTNSAIGCMFDPGNLPCAVMVQAHLPEQWEERIEGFSTLRVHIIKTVQPYELPEADVYIFSYSKIHGWVDVAATGFFKMVVMDEPQELRAGFGTQKGGAAKAFCDKALAVLGMTATPVMNYGIEMFHVMEFIAPGALGRPEEFIREWCPDGKIVKDPDALGAYLREQLLLLRRTEDDVGQQMPRPNVTTHPVEYDRDKAAQSEDLAYRLAISATTGTFNERGKAYRELDALTRHTTGVAKAEGVAEYVRILLDAELPVLLSGWHRECFAAGTDVLMFDGNVVAVEDVKIGDLLMGPDSRPRVVGKLINGSGVLYKIVPNKGEPWVCSENHILTLWRTENPHAGAVKMTALQYFTLSERKRRRYALYRADCVEFEERCDVFEPWLVGYWLGDGASSLADLRVSTADEEVVSELRAIAARSGVALKDYECKRGTTACRFYAFSTGIGGKWGRNPILNGFNELCLHKNKHIPLSYLTARPNQRLELLAGLLDSDGHVCRGNGVGSAEFSNSNERLANEVAFLARSLGFAAYVKEATRSPSGFKSTKKAYRVYLSGDLTRIPTRILRKKASVRHQTKSVLRTGFKIECLGSGLFYGFEIDGDHLFLLGDFTVVHNCYDIWNSALKDYAPVMYTGSESKVQKRKAKHAFACGDSNLMIISNRSGAGLDGLQFRCNDVVIGELDWSPMVLKQLIGRIRRTGQKDVVNAHYMIANGGSDPLMVEVLGLKSSQAHGIMNPFTQPVAPVSDTDRMKRLAQMVLDRRQAIAA